MLRPAVRGLGAAGGGGLAAAYAQRSRVPDDVNAQCRYDPHDADSVPVAPSEGTDQGAAGFSALAADAFGLVVPALKALYLQ